MNLVIFGGNNKTLKYEYSEVYKYGCPVTILGQLSLFLFLRVHELFIYTI
jgi:hypothetical protein